MTVSDAALMQTEQFLRVGLGYRKTYSDGVVLTLNRLRESRGEWSGELQVDKQYPAVHVTEYLGSFRWNLSSLTSRRTAAAYLDKRAGDPDIRWEPRLDLFANDVLRDRYKGAELEFVGEGDLPDEPANLLGPCLPCKEITTLYAPGGTGKSTLAAAFALSVESGREIVPGWVPIYSAPVLVLDFEGRARTWHKRLAEIAAGAGIVSPRVRYMRYRGRLADHLEQIATICTDHGIGFVIVDSVEAASGAGDGEGWNDRVGSLYEAVGQLDATALLIDHTTGDAAARDDGQDRPYGGVMKVNWSRQVWRLQREKEPVDNRAELLLTNTKNNEDAKAQPIGLVVSYTDVAISLRTAVVEAPELARNYGTADRMARLLRNGALTTKEIADELEVKVEVIRKVLSRSHRFTRLPDQRIGLASYV